MQNPIVLLAMTAAGWLASSCSNELDPQSPVFQPYPVVSGVIELHRDTIGIRLTRTYSGVVSASQSAKIEDSLYFPQARVWLEKWNGTFLAGRAELKRVDPGPRDPGFFMESPNWNYILVKTDETKLLFAGTSDSEEYQLNVDIPGLPPVFARTRAYPPAEWHNPRLWVQTNLFLNPLEFSWSTTAPYTELFFRMSYTDVYEDAEAPRTISWREFHSTEPNRAGSDFVFGQEFMKRIAGQIRFDRQVLYRRVTAVHALVTGIPSDLYEYRQMIATQPVDQVGFPLTNVVNGIGLFTSRTITAFPLELDQRSKDSIVSGIFTKQFNFRFY